jgi:hypothetical protein
VSNDSDESDGDIKPMPKIKPNPNASQGPRVLPPIQPQIRRQTIETPRQTIETPQSDIHSSSSDETSDSDDGVTDPYHPTPPTPAADRGRRGGRGTGRGAGAGAGAGQTAGPSAGPGPSAGTPAGPPAGRGGRAHRDRVLRSSGARANIAALDAALAAELARNNVGGIDDNPANADEPPGPFDKLNKMDHKHLVRKCDIQYRINRLVSTYLKSKLK